MILFSSYMILLLFDFEVSVKQNELWLCEEIAIWT